MKNNQNAAMLSVRLIAEQSLDPETFDLFAIIYNQIISNANMEIQKICVAYKCAKEVLDAHNRRIKD